MTAKKSNAALASLLAEIGWSPYDLARAVNRVLGDARRIHPTTPFTWRDRGVVPRGSLPSLVAGVLSEAHGRAVTEQELWPQLAESPQVHLLAVDGLDGSWTSQEGLNLLGAAPAVGAGGVRRFFAISGRDLVNVAARWSDGVPELLTQRRHGSGTVTEELVDYLVRDAAALRRLDDGHGGALVQLAVSHRLSLTVDLLRRSRYTARDGRALASVVAQLAQLAGWLHFDLGDDGEAQRCYLLALRAAGLSGDQSLAAMILSALAAQQTWRQQPHDAVALLGIAATGMHAETCSQVRAILDVRQARASAMLGNEADATAAVTRAERMLGRAGGEDAPPWAYWLNESVVAGETGRSLLELGRTSAAVIHLDRVTGMLGDEVTRDRVLYGLTLSKAHAAMRGTSTGDIEHACFEASRVLPLMGDVKSVRCRTMLGDVMTMLIGHDTSCVRELREGVGEMMAAQV